LFAHAITAPQNSDRDGGEADHMEQSQQGHPRMACRDAIELVDEVDFPSYVRNVCERTQDRRWAGSGSGPGMCRPYVFSLYRGNNILQEIQSRIKLGVQWCPCTAHSRMLLTYGCEVDCGGCWHEVEGVKETATPSAVPSCASNPLSGTGLQRNRTSAIPSSPLVFCSSARYALRALSVAVDKADGCMWVHVISETFNGVSTVDQKHRISNHLGG
jgi:hypothetical protein